MNQTEELIKAALARSVENTPHPGPVINALNQRRRRRVRPLVIALIAAATVAAAVAVPVALRQPEASAPPATELPPPVTATGTAKTVPMRYRIPHLPAGFVETGRRSDLDLAEQARTWTKGIQRMTLEVVTSRSPEWEVKLTATGKGGGTDGKTTVAGHPGRLAINEPTYAVLEWRPQPDVLLSLSLWDNDKPADKLMALAQTVEPDNKSVVQAPLRFKTLPDRFTRTAVTVMGDSPDTARTVVEVSVPGREVSMIAASIEDKDEGSHTGAVITPLPDGRAVHLLRLGTVDLTDDQLRELAKGVVVEPAADLSWIGR
nr:hypothetical protein [Kibdelosporangium sp. MJ126-NF4]CEL22002.1 hypothetical protein [Kibdelosporangium sp. MJ126-NF4]CTQ92782.1 hypothetical protein [Kibdelosporangium sp. MJ126-NF4]